MAKSPELISVSCPCCQGVLHIDPQTKAVIRFEEHVKPPTLADLETGVAKLRGDAARREEAIDDEKEQTERATNLASSYYDARGKITH